MSNTWEEWDRVLHIHCLSLYKYQAEISIQTHFCFRTLERLQMSVAILSWSQFRCLWSTQGGSVLSLSPPPLFLLLLSSHEKPQVWREEPLLLIVALHMRHNREKHGFFHAQGDTTNRGVCPLQIYCFCLVSSIKELADSSVMSTFNSHLNGMIYLLDPAKAHTAGMVRDNSACGILGWYSLKSELFKLCNESQSLL